MRGRGRRRPDDDVPEPPAPSTARATAIRLLARRDYTSAELRDRLVARGYTEDVADDLIARLVDERWLDDRRVAAAHARTSSQIKGRGRLRIRRELQARGLDDDAAREAVAALPEGNDRDAIRRFLARKRVARPLAPDVRRRLFQQLLRRGFAVADIEGVLREK